MTTLKSAPMNEFYRVYARLLGEAVLADPKRFAYKPEDVDNVARKMTEALAAKQAIISPTVKVACKELGIKPNVGMISAYLNQKTH